MSVKKKCLHATCRTLIPFTESYCDDHNQHRRYNKERNKVDKKYVDFYNSKKWKDKRYQRLLKDEFLCQMCLRNGYYRTGNIVHHIIEVKENWSKRLDINNLETLCTSCHNKIHK